MTKINEYTIHEPIWDGGTKERAIGIAEFRLPCIVDIDYKLSLIHISEPTRPY